MEGKHMSVVTWSLDRVTWPSHLTRHTILSRHFQQVMISAQHKLPPPSDLRLCFNVRPITYACDWNLHLMLSHQHFTSNPKSVKVKKSSAVSSIAKWWYELWDDKLVLLYQHMFRDDNFALLMKMPYASGDSVWR